MSAAIQQKRPKLSDLVQALIDLLAAGGGDREGFLRFGGRTRYGVGQTQIHALAEPGGIPPAVLERLGNMWAVEIGLAVVGPGHDPQPRRLGALAVTWHVPRVCRDPRRPRDAQARHGRHWIFDVAGIEAAVAKAMSAPWGRPAMIVDAGMTLSALWTLAPPAEARSPKSATDLLELHRAAARLLGAHVPEERATLRDLRVPVPGSVIREGRDLDYVDAQLITSTPCSVETIKAALTAKEKK